MHEPDASVSIVVPVYNGAGTLSRCLEALLSQDHPFLEIVVVDNGSTDETKDVILDFAGRDERVRYVFEPRRSRGAARNRGVTASRGEVIAMIDADCMAPVTWLGALTEPIREGRESATCGNERIICKGFFAEQRVRYGEEFRGLRMDGDYINYLETKNCALLKSLILDLGMFNPLLGNSEDSDLAIRLLSKGNKILYVKDCLVDHMHDLSAAGWFLKQADRSYWLNRSFSMNEAVLDCLPQPSYAKMEVVEFFSLFFNAPFHLILSRNKKDSLFELLTGLAYRAGLVVSFLA